MFALISETTLAAEPPSISNILNIADILSADLDLGDLNDTDETEVQEKENENISTEDDQDEVQDVLMKVNIGLSLEVLL